MIGANDRGDTMEIRLIILSVLGIIILATAIYLLFSSTSKSGYTRRKPKDWVSTEEFQVWKSKIKPSCTELEFIHFLDFLYSYGGGFIKRSYGKIVRQEYLGKEKGDLKGIFYNVVVPAPHISTPRKEEFRQFLINIGVRGVSERPKYETRDSKLKNNKTDVSERARKDVGNEGEQIVRDVLSKLGDEYSVINGPVIRFGSEVKEYDHIVVGYNGVFIIETKAFGMTDGKPTKAKLYVNNGDKWTVQKGNNRNEVNSPTEQVLEEQALIKKLLSSYITDVYSIVALSNTLIEIRNNIKLPYTVVKADEVNAFIISKPVFLNEGARQAILTSLNNCRQN